MDIFSINNSVQRLYANVWRSPFSATVCRAIMTQPPPNVLILMADGWRRSSLGFMQQDRSIPAFD